MECYNLDTGQMCYKYDLPARVRCLAISANDVYLAVGLDTGVIYLIDLTHEGILRVIEEPFGSKPVVESLSFSTDGKELITSIRIFETVHTLSYPLPFTRHSHYFTCKLTKVRRNRLHPMFYSAH